MTSEATLEVLVCNAGNGEDCIAQNLSDASGRTVIAPNTYLNFNETTGEPFFRWWRFGGYTPFIPTNEKQRQ